MRKAIRRIVARLWPEIESGYHLDRYARILNISNPPAGGETCDRMTPHFAADIEIIDVNGQPVPNFPKYEAVPLPLPMAGNEEGFFMYPRPGAIVTVRWIEGNPAHPVIQHVYPMGLKLPAVPDNMARWQQRAGVFQTVDPDGNWNRETDKDIRDKAENITVEASANSSEEIGQTKTIKAGANVLFEAPAITIKAPNGGADLLPELTSALNEIKAALDIIASHTHPNVSASTQASAISATASEVNGRNEAIKGLMG